MTSGQRGAEDAGEVVDDAHRRDRFGQLVLGDDLSDHCAHRRLGERGGDAPERGEEEQERDRLLPGGDQDAERDRRRDGEHVAEHDDATAGEPVGERAADGRQQQEGQELRDQAE